METIVCAAFRCPFTGAVSEGDFHVDAFRHAEIYRRIVTELSMRFACPESDIKFEDVHTDLAMRIGGGNPAWEKLGECDGFVTSNGRFVGRVEAYHIAVAAKQCRRYADEYLLAECITG